MNIAVHTGALTESPHIGDRAGEVIGLTPIWARLPQQSFAFYSKTALLEGLEVDQYMLGILIYIQK